MSLRRAVPLICICTLLLAAGLGPTCAETLSFWKKIEKVADNTNELGAIAQSPTGEMWLLERTTGLVKVTFNGKDRASLTLPVTSTNRAGLLGVAFAPDYGTSGIAFVYYVDNTVKARVDRLRLAGATLRNEGRILDLGTVSDTTKPGGGIVVGKDGKLYVGVGDLGAPSSAQDDNVNVGKVLRANLDGSVPADNPIPGILCYAKGFRDTRALAVNFSSAYAEGTFYTPDGGAVSPSAADEVNAVKRGGNYAWSSCSGGSCAGYEQPLVTWPSTGLVNPTSVAVNARTAFGASAVNALYVAATDDGDASKKGRIRELTLSGANLDLLGTNNVLFDPRGDIDGTIESVCPTKLTALAMGGDGALYAANGGASATNTGLWRIYQDAAGPREVSGPGTMFPLVVERSAGSLKLTWESLGTLDAGKAKRAPATARAEAYRIWEGDLAALRAGNYSMSALLSTNGTADGVGRLTATLTPGSGAKYYLVQAQNDNYEGKLGTKSDGAAIPYPAGVTTDYCTDLTYGRTIGTCVRDFDVALKDYNKRSPTYGQRLHLRDFRGKVYKLALAAENCGWCELEVQQENVVDNRWRDQDFIFLSVFTKDYGVWHVYANEAECQSAIDLWVSSNNNPSSPIFCDEDLNGDTIGDYSLAMDQCRCAPQNFYVDPGGVIYNYIQGAQFSQDVSNNVKNEVNPEGCD